MNLYQVAEESRTGWRTFSQETRMAGARSMGGRRSSRRTRTGAIAPVLRVFPRRQRGGPGRQPSDRLDRDHRPRLHLFATSTAEQVSSLGSLPPSWRSSLRGRWSAVTDVIPILLPQGRWHSRRHNRPCEEQEFRHEEDRPRSLRRRLSGEFISPGTIRFLRDAGILPQVSHITSVSGGSIFAAHLVLNWDRYNGSPKEFDAAASEFLAFVRLDVRNRITRRFPLTLPLHWPRRLLGRSNRKLHAPGSRVPL